MVASAHARPRSASPAAPPVAREGGARYWRWSATRGATAADRLIYRPALFEKGARLLSCLQKRPDSKETPAEYNPRRIMLSMA